MPKTIGILGKKIGMTRVYAEDGTALGVTVLQAGPCYVTQRKTVEKEGYNAIQVGFDTKKDSRVNKPLAGHFKSAGKGAFYHLQEFRVDNPGDYELGQEIVITDMFNVGDVIDVTGTAKGKGFQGVMKRHNFAGGPGGHGSGFHRAPGSIGMCAWPARVVKGKKLPGRMGGQTVTKKSVKIVDIRVEDNALLVKGAIPGAKQGLLHIHTK
ncbi:MAG: 50S ribosomal protein L3 [Desulfobulbaceae bacterium]|jgi:large subunit ribosomal protein L3|nr:50S ribosomal protein L3 [Desulfobulbaceae bacterium]